MRPVAMVGMRSTAAAVRTGCSSWMALALLGLATAGLAEGPAPPAAGDGDSLARREADLVRQYRELERSLLRLADLLSASDPRRAGVLRDAFEQAREAEVGDRLGRIVGLLEEGRLLAAGTSQEGALEQFRRLLELLEEGGRDRNLADTKRDVRQFLARITKLIARQREIEGATEAGGDEGPLADRQQENAAEAADLAEELERFVRRLDGPPPRGDAAGKPTQPGDQQPGDQQPGDQQPGDQQPGDQQPRPGRAAGDPGGDPGEESDDAAGEQAAAAAEPTGDDEVSRTGRTRRRVQAAELRMREALNRLEDARRGEARLEQQRAIEELESARAELEEILRQMREEEVERLLVQLETRVRTMLKAEREILAAAAAAATAAMSARERQLEAARLAREQEAVTAEADRALALVRDDGSAVAIPQALGQVRDDSAQTATRLRATDLTGPTLDLAGDIVTGLEELLAAVERSRPDEDGRREQAGPGGGRPAEPGERPLVDKLAELKMLRSLQARLNTRTDRLSELLAGGDEAVAEPAAVAALRRLAERQRAIERAARDIVAGRTEP